jgi:hypothetical protein
MAATIPRRTIMQANIRLVIATVTDMERNGA